MAHDHSLSTEDVLEDVADADDLSLVNTSVIRLGCALLGLSLPGVAACYFYVRIGISGRLTSVCGNKEVRLNESCLDGFNCIGWSWAAALALAGAWSFQRLALSCTSASGISSILHAKTMTTTAGTEDKFAAPMLLVVRCGRGRGRVTRCVFAGGRDTFQLASDRGAHERRRLKGVHGGARGWADRGGVVFGTSSEA